MSGLDPDRATLESWLHVLGEVALDDIADLDAVPAVGTVGRAGLGIASEVSVPIGEAPLPGGAQRIAEIVRRAASASFRTNGPGYLAYVPGGGLPAAAVAAFVADVLNRYTGVAGAAPALCRLEADVLSWLADAFGYDKKARGLLTSGGSMANLSAIVTARYHHLSDSGDFRRAIVYVSDQAHHSVAKAIALAGIPARNVRAVPTDDRLRLDPRALQEAISSDRATGMQPFLVVSAAGTTNTGAVDPLPALADVCRDQQLWHHVDAAYGGAFVLCEAGREALAGIERADSITFDPHKGLFLPYGVGCLLVKDGERLRQAHRGRAAYLQDFDTLDHTGEPPSPAEYGPELSRDFRGIRVWLPLMLHGAAAFREALADKLELARRFYTGLQARIRQGLPVEIVDAPQLSTVPFRLRRRPDEALTAYNERNAAWLAAINAREHVYLSSTALPVADGSAFTLRVCILSFRTRARHIDACLEDLTATAAAGC